MAAVVNFLSHHLAYVGGAGFALLSVYYFCQGDVQTGGHDLMLALTAFGLKSVAAKILASVR